MPLPVILRRPFVCAHLAILVLAISPAAQAHRLDELLQRSFISIEPAQVSIEFSLTPGIERAAEFIDSLDTNQDGKVSPSESAAFAANVSGQLALSIDGQRHPLTLVDVTVPDLDAIRTGAGDLQIQFTATLPESPRETRALRFSNNYLPAGSVYLTTAFAPVSPGIRVGRLRRDEAQRSLAFDFSVPVRPAPAPASPPSSANRRP